ncbi:MAG: hypothetical protein A3C70_00510 [Candidatus Zambryskibacteria bacterium RIFCSPHIGHO2_02_FULL_43_14]|uniref:Uncharacterized protein n=1 Tax=Candidatus Zambryskibacteria bacterium RIFCSPHIGHO2_02_FULL_43_14 TaxID=1802748 RepID=A0A1G2TJM4_9BACT|nr:MAG: hypothetical protein A2829_02085 [Candidatus Zambryskibacteria bacterium RIFCSPHIGHO2_01_FULL_43_60]OHA96821.1 MAG: hypothetical protein A3C70_00510 [Candidatus Zambryskibacteria bacterium RIFCSPHIGHO2_02_FULL_43_14]OHB04077.1 MAG: hypothetical protein A3B03_01335 [Candidatus Zambryskibacteria bacterium RIFCSPLOWO2_01_FULL_42_41]
MNRGFIGKFVLIIIALAALKYFFDWSVFDAASSEQGRKTISYIREVLDTAWSYIKVPATILWQKTLGLLPFSLNFYENN